MKEEVVKWIVENKPHLIEIEEEVLKIGQYGELDIRVSVRAGQVQKLSFYGGKTWLKGKAQFDSTNA